MLIKLSLWLLLEKEINSRTVAEQGRNYGVDGYVSHAPINASTGMERLGSRSGKNNECDCVF